MEELEQQTKDVLEGRPPTTNIFPFQYAFNIFSHNSGITDTGYNEEEMKLVKETKKIWGETDVAITATCIRVPVMRAHAESINLEFAQDMSEEQAREVCVWGEQRRCQLRCRQKQQAPPCFQVLSAAPGVQVIDDRAANRFPTPLDASTKDDVFVGRIRRDISRSDSKGLDLFVCGDQIKKGAALNAVQIAELLLKN